MAHCFGARNHKCLISSKKSGPCSFLPIGYSSDTWKIFISETCNSYSSFLGCLEIAPKSSAEVSMVIFWACSQTSSLTSALLTIAWIKPEPSLICKKQMLHEERKL